MGWRSLIVLIVHFEEARLEKVLYENVRAIHRIVVLKEHKRSDFTAKKLLHFAGGEGLLNDESNANFADSKL